MSNPKPHCPICGYTKEDAQINGDHYLCHGSIPGTKRTKKEARELRAKKAVDEFPDWLKQIYSIKERYEAARILTEEKLDHIVVHGSCGDESDFRRVVASHRNLLEEYRLLVAEVERLRAEVGEYRSRIECLAMFVRRLYYRLRKHEPDAEMIKQANTYLKSIGQAGTPFRAEECV